MNQLGKERANKHAERLYYKDFDSLVGNYSKINALASALNEAEAEIADLRNVLGDIPCGGSLSEDTVADPLSSDPEPAPLQSAMFFVADLAKDDILFDTYGKYYPPIDEEYFKQSNT